jgi:hypothetical protein
MRLPRYKFTGIQDTGTATNTRTLTRTFTNTSTRTATSIITNTPTRTATSMVTNTPTPTATETTGGPATDTYTPTITGTSTQTATQTLTSTLTATATMTATLASTPTEPPPAPFTGAAYTYDGGDNMVKSVVNGITTYYASSSYVVETDGTTTTVRKTYMAGSTSIAVRTIVGEEDTLNWTLGDHLGSSSVTTTANGTWYSELRYSAFGETRYSSGITPTPLRANALQGAGRLPLYGAIGTS